MGGGTGSRERYEALLYGDGVFKSLFKFIKGGAAGRGLERVFITGVSPVVLSDATSGYNVAKHISFEPALHDLCGFWEAEVAEALDEIAAECGYPPERAGEALATMRSFYNGYAFTYDAKELIYNPTLALYYFDHFQRHCEAPRPCWTATSPATGPRSPTWPACRTAGVDPGGAGGGRGHQHSPVGGSLRRGRDAGARARSHVHGLVAVLPGGVDPG